MVDMYLALVMYQRRTIGQVPIGYRSAVMGDLIALGLDGNGYPIVPSIAPIVSADDVNNLIVGASNLMEISVDGSAYVVYNPLALPDLSGDHTVNVRVAAVVFVTSASLPTTLVFTTIPVPVTPLAPNVTNDDTLNTVIGMTTGMESNLDGAGYVAYDEVTFNAIDLSGEHTLLVRVSAEGINPVSADTTLVFTTNVVTA